MLQELRKHGDTVPGAHGLRALVLTTDTRRREELARGCRALGCELLELADDELRERVRACLAGADLPDVVLVEEPETGRAWRPEFDRLPLTPAKGKLIQSYERARIRMALEACDGNISRAARRLGIYRQSLQQKLRELGLRRKSVEGENGASRAVDQSGSLPKRRM